MHRLLVILTPLLFTAVMYGQSTGTNNSKEDITFIDTTIKTDTNKAVPKKPVLYIRDFQNNGTAQDALADIMKRSLKHIMEMTTRYDVLLVEDLPQYLAANVIDATNLTNWTEGYIKNNFIRLGFDEMVTGIYSLEKGGSNINLDIKEYQFASDKTLFERKYRSSTDADIFESIDRIGGDLASSLTGKKLNIGALYVSTSLTNGTIFIDGIASTKTNVKLERVIAGTQHTVEIKDQQNQTLFTRKVTILDQTISDVYFGFDEYVEVINASNVTKLKKQEYEKQIKLLAQGENYLRFGLKLTVGEGGFMWAGPYLDYQNLSIELNTTFIPRLPKYMYDNYIGLGGYATLSVYRPDKSILNPYLRLGILSYYGLELGFVPQSPYLHFGFGVAFHPDWDFMPGFIRGLYLSLEGSTFQDTGIFYKNFAQYQDMNSKTKINPMANVGGTMLSFGIKF